MPQRCASMSGLIALCSRIRSLPVDRRTFLVCRFVGASRSLGALQKVLLPFVVFSQRLIDLMLQPLRFAQRIAAALFEVAFLCDSHRVYQAAKFGIVHRTSNSLNGLNPANFPFSTMISS